MPPMLAYDGSPYVLIVCWLKPWQQRICPYIATIYSVRLHICFTETCRVEYIQEVLHLLYNSQSPREIPSQTYIQMFYLVCFIAGSPSLSMFCPLERVAQS